MDEDGTLLPAAQSATQTYSATPATEAADGACGVDAEASWGRQRFGGHDKFLSAIEAIASRPQTPRDVACIHTIWTEVSLPHQQKKLVRHERSSGKASIVVTGGDLNIRSQDGEAKMIQTVVPCGVAARLLLLEIEAEVLRTQSLVVNLESSPKAWLKKHKRSYSATVADRYVEACLNLCGMHLTVGFDGATWKIDPIERVEEYLVRENGRPWPRRVLVREAYANLLWDDSYVVHQGAQIALSTVGSLAMDIDRWLSRRLHDLQRIERVPWPRIQEQFGASTTGAQEGSWRRMFVKAFEYAIAARKGCKASADVDWHKGGVFLVPSPDAVKRQERKRGARPSWRT
ncbi:MAG: hypothetical protein WC809_07445 [Sinimarinibacterium sp.]|jgi:hypothetical protein